MYLFDTDHITFLRSGSGVEYVRIISRMKQHPITDFYHSTVSFHEQVLGANKVIQQAGQTVRVCDGYRLLHSYLSYYASTQLLDFDQQALAQFVALRKQKVRIGTMDLRIASIALAHDMTVLTRNLRDFQQVPGLACEDWTA
jgi:tRNA(fMet)-specific endonuclease VapC